MDSRSREDTARQMPPAAKDSVLSRNQTCPHGQLPASRTVRK